MSINVYDRATEVTPYDRMFACLNGKKLDRVPVEVHPRWAALEYIGVTFRQAWDDPDLFVKAQIMAQERFQYDSVADYSMMGPVEEAIGATLKYPEDDVPQIAEPFIKTKEDMKKAKWKLDPRRDGNMPKQLYLIRRLKEELIKRGKGKQQVPIITWGSCPSRTAACLTGFKEWFMIVAKQPDWAVELMELALDGWLQMVIAAHEAGADTVWVNDPVSSADCISRSHYEKLTQPYERKFIEAIRRETGMNIAFHPCGNWHDRLDLIYENQADGYFLGPMNIDLCAQKAKEIVEKGTNPYLHFLNGNYGAATKTSTADRKPVPYATTLKFGTPAELLEECKIVIDTVEGADIRCMLGPNCHEPKNTPFVNRDATIYAARAFGQYK